MKAASDIAASLGIVIEDVESMDYCGDRVVWRWSNELRLHIMTDTELYSN